MINLKVEDIREELLDKYSQSLTRWKKWRAGRVSDVNNMDVNSFVKYEILIRELIPGYSLEYNMLISKKSPRRFFNDKNSLALIGEIYDLPQDIVELRVQGRKKDLTKLPRGKEVFPAVYSYLNRKSTVICK